MGSYSSFRDTVKGKALKGRLGHMTLTHDLLDIISNGAGLHLSDLLYFV